MSAIGLSTREIALMDGVFRRYPAIQGVVLFGSRAKGTHSPQSDIDLALIGIENGYSIGTDLSRIREFAERGGRYMSLAHNGHSQLADSNTGERDDVWLHKGLSDLGKQAIAELNGTAADPKSAFDLASQVLRN